MKFVPVFPTLRADGLHVGPGPNRLPFPLEHPRSQLWYLGRNAIRAMVQTLGMQRGEPVIVPSYTNGMEVAALAHAGLEIHTVGLRADLRVDLRHLEELIDSTGARLVSIIHYLGFPQPVDDVLEICRAHGAWLLEDCALALMSSLPDGRPLGSVGDFSIFCLYKSLPVSDGAVLVVNNPKLPLPASPDEPELVSTVSALGRLLLNSARAGGSALRGAAEILDQTRRLTARALAARNIERIPVGGMELQPKSLTWGASKLTRRALPWLRYEGAVARRRANYQRLLDRVSLPTFFRALPEGVCPLFFPVITHEKDAFRETLARHGIESMDFWSTWHPTTPPHDHPDVAFLRNHVVEVPCAHTLDVETMDYVADVIEHARPASEPRWPRRPVPVEQPAGRPVVHG